MVCLQDEVVVRVTVKDTIQQSPSNKKSRLDSHLTPSKKIDTIFREISRDFDYNTDEIELTLQGRDGSYFVLNEHRDKTVREAGILCNPDDRFIIIIGALKSKKMTLFVPDVTEDELSLGASASPTAGDGPTSESTPVPMIDYDYEYKNYAGSSRMPVHNYVGLVNQAMTCYLNSLLQALYMTPEFRNALYNWEFDGVVESRSIPFQLQKLFLNLQTSTKSAVETTDLTTSFGWQGSDAWHQHDIQELCRVMFDALEHKFKDTKQANLINDLYEGKMLDYVKCLECGTEKSREDTFLDIPLPVRPFGSTVAYNSVEEALRAFVLPETLDGNNQYHCEKCNKKCDAHKGLKFTKFPYLLTLHLKRFDFDYNTMHRIKLNDKVVFPEMLNLNSFIPASRAENNEQIEEKETVKCDDCSTTDSGSADDESCQGTDVSSTVNGQDDNCADSDEGIDVSSGNNHNEIDAKGPYVYELFSIMIHSGSASGGHYYAYIKDFDKNLWFCFNDQSVTGITEDDIRKTYGGGPQRGFYSGAYSSSTNAYMLMYRQIDKDRNCQAMKVDEFPPYIQKLLKDMRRKEEEDRINREKEDHMIKIPVYCYKLKGFLLDLKISVFTDSTLADAAQRAHQRFKLDGLVALEDCRLVLYNKKHNCIDKSFESDELAFCDLGMSKPSLLRCHWFLETREPGTPWKVYKENGINVKVYYINTITEDIEEPVLIRVDTDETIGALKKDLGNLLQLDPNTLIVVKEQYHRDLTCLDNDEELLNFDLSFTDSKLFLTSVPQEEYKVNKFNVLNSLEKVIAHFRSLISLNVVLPDTDISTLEIFSIPSLDLNQNLDKSDISGDRGSASPGLRVSPQPAAGGSMCGDGFGDQSQSNSEDSSLSDSDRTLVGDAPGECLALLSSSSNSPADQHMASPSDPCQDTYNYDVLGHPAGEEMHWDEDETQPEVQKFTNYFKITSFYENGDANSDTCSRSCRVLADQQMTLKRLKKHLELVLKVPSEYFKVYKQTSNSEEHEWTCLTEKLNTLHDGQRLIVKLGRVLREGEYNTKIYHLKPDCLEMNNFLFEHIVSEGDTIFNIKREILLQAKKQHLLDIPYNKCRLREKSWKKPRKVFLDDQKFPQDMMVTYNVEMYLQELTEPDTVTSSNQLVVFVRKWCPATLSLGPIQELVLETNLMGELKNKLSDLSGIPKEFVDVAHTKSSFPCDIHVLEIHHDLDWNPNVTHLDQRPVSADDGSLFFYKDNRESLKSITPEERQELEVKENARLGRPSIKSYSPGRERALKIYLDNSPCKQEDCID